MQVLVRPGTARAFLVSGSTRGPRFHRMQLVHRWGRSTGDILPGFQEPLDDFVIGGPTSEPRTVYCHVTAHRSIVSVSLFSFLSHAACADFPTGSKVHELPPAEEKRWVETVKTHKTLDGATVMEVLKHAEQMRQIQLS